MNQATNPARIAAALDELWSPRILAEVDDAYVKVAKVQGRFDWHSHADEDEFFLVLKGRLRIELEQETIELGEGEMFVVPKGVRHCPSAESETHVLLIERKSTRHTGDSVSALTRSLDQQLRPPPA